MCHRYHRQLNQLNMRFGKISPQQKIDIANIRLQSVSARLSRSVAESLGRTRTKLEQVEKRLGNVNLSNVLQRGFTLLYDDNGKLITSSKAIGAGDKLEVEFYDGRVGVQAD